MELVLNKKTPLNHVEVDGLIFSLSQYGPLVSLGGIHLPFQVLHSREEILAPGPRQEGVGYVVPGRRCPQRKNVVTYLDVEAIGQPKAGLLRSFC